MDEFLLTRSRSSHLILVITTRTVEKSKATLAALHNHVRQFVRSKRFRQRYGAEYAVEDAVSRVHFLSIELDLCNFASIYKGADKLTNGSLRPIGEDGGEGPAVSLPRLDTVILNAGTGLWTGIDFRKVIHSLFVDGPVHVGMYPCYKICAVGSLVYPLGGKAGPRRLAASDPVPSSPPAAGEAFCANVFGHYMLVRRLLPLLTRPAAGSGGSSIPSARVIWTSSTEPLRRHLNLEHDFQGIRNPEAYESTKRLTDLLVLSADLPGVRKYSAPYLSLTDKQQPADTAADTTTAAAAATVIPPKMYLVQPGIVCSNIFPLNIILTFGMYCVAYLLRWAGSPWHTISPYFGASAPTWLTLATDDTLTSLHANAIKWGSAVTSRFFPEATVLMTEVDGWGWDGTVEDRDAIARDPAQQALRKMTWRDPRIPMLTKEGREEFEVQGAACWREMERLRVAFEKCMDEAGPEKEA